ncbi:MAG: ATP-binding protein [Candidatus Nomurabacteria bacterium]|jgi:predicted AAA+ superfamily ATPase|nr:ATP-binding protein [Candidatus Nomurabacteria bacterium]
MKKYIKRRYDNLEKHIIHGKITVIYGPRQIGKTTLVDNYLDGLKNRQIYRTTGEDRTTIEALSSQSVEKLKDFAGTYDYIFVDEAQAIPGVGLGLKMLIDALPDKKIIVTGSSSFDLTYKLGEPLTGRQNKLILYPVSLGELEKTFGRNAVKGDLADYLTFGMYPEIRAIDGRNNKIRRLDSLVESYLLRDILQIVAVKNPLAIRRLLTALAYQIGSLVSLNELASIVQIDVKTVQRYIDLLTQSFVIYPLGGYSRNLRNEMVQKRKYYFYDVGIRNAIIGDFNDPMIRGDIGGLFENFVVMERAKYRAYGELFYANDFFWRNDVGQEIDLVEDHDGVLHGLEIKWNPNAKFKTPTIFTENYPNSTIDLITRDNLLKFLV